MARERSSMVIQRVATGFLDLFGLKTTGESPPIVSNELTAVVDATDLYTVNRQVVVSAAGSQNIATVTSLPILGPTCPTGFIWMVHSVWLYVGVAPAGVGYEVVPGLFMYSQSFVPVGPRITVATGQICWEGRTFERPRLLRPADRIAFVQTSVTGTPSIPTTVAAVVTPLLV